MKVIIPYARNRIAYCVLRSLTRAGHECFVADSARFPMCRFSRLSKGFRRCPTSGSEFVVWYNEMRHDGFVVFPTFVESWLLQRHDLMKNALPPYDTLRRANNKWEVYKLCKELNIPVPTTQMVADSVIKPVDGRGSKGRVYVSRAVLQERIYGDAIGVGMLFNHGVLKAKFAWKRLQEFPKDGGLSVTRMSTTFPEQEHYAEKLLEALKWHGVAMVEFKGQYVLEVNPRFWGSVQLAVDSGVDFPRLLLDIMTKGDCEEVMQWNLGVKTSWLAGCIRRMCLPKGNIEDFSFRDPVPFLAQFLLPVQNVLKGNGLVLDEN